MTKKKGTNFLVQGSILAVAGIIVRLIGLLYRVPLTNIIGESGIGIYSTAYNVYNILLLISSYTLPLAVSRLVAARLSEKQYRNSRKLFSGALIFAAFSGGIMGAVTWFGADLFAGIMKMPQAAYAIKTLAPTIVIMAFLGVLRGYFQGHNTMIPTAVSQIIEQIINAAVSVIAAGILFRRGTAADLAAGREGYYSYAFGAAGGTIGTGAGALSALLFFLFLYTVYKPTIRKRCARDRSGVEDTYGYAVKVLVMTIIPVLLSTTVYQISTIIDQSIYAEYIGGDYESIWGAYSGKYTLLIHVPTAIAAAMGSSIIPTLAAAMQRRSLPEAVNKSGTAIRFNMIIAIPASVGLAVLASPIMDLLFRGDNTAASHMMLIGSTLVLFNALSTITNSILQGIGNIWIPVRNALIALAFHVGVLVLLLWGFDLDMDGVIIANIFFYVLMCILNNISLHRILDYRQEWKKTFFSPLLSSAVMGAAAYYSYQLIYRLYPSNAAALLTAIVLAVLIFLVLLILTGGMDEADLLSLPKGRTIAKAAKKLHLIR